MSRFKFIFFLIIPVFMFGKANNLIDLKITDSVNEYIIELVFENELEKYDSYSMESPPRILVDIQNCKSNLNGKNQIVDYKPLYNYRISEWGSGKKITKVVFEYHRLPLYSLFTEDRSMIIKWDKQVETKQEVFPEYIPRTNLDNKISMQFDNASLQGVLKLLAIQNNLNIISGDDVEGEVSVTLNDVTVGEMLDAVLKVNGYNWFQQGEIIIVKPFDTDLSGETITRVYKLDYVDATSVSSAIQNVLSNKGKLSIFSPSIKGGASGAGGMGTSGGATAGATGGMGALGGLTGALGGASGGGTTGGTGATQGSSLGGMSGITYDMILITDMEQNFRHIEDIINQLDIQIQQINISVKFIETKLDIAEKMGINWNLRASLTGGPTAIGDNITIGKFDNLGLAVLTISELSSVIELLNTSTESKLIQEPQITTSDNNPASINVGTSYPLAVTQPATQFGPATVTYEEQEVNITLNVTPHINEDKYISMMVNTQIEAVTGFAGPDLDRPIVSTRSTNTNVRIPDGSTLMIGGLILEQDIITEKGIPILKSIPILGHFFKHTTNTPQRSELLLFITANILRSVE